MLIWFIVLGPEDSDNTTRGIIPRMFDHLFEGVGKASDTVEFEISASYCEIYMEKIKDLLNRMLHF
jgi:kinesin family protein 5